MRKVLEFHKSVDTNGVEYLDVMPDIVADIIEKAEGNNTRDVKLALLYIRIADEQNYFQSNDPTAFGNPEYSRLQGIVCGFCAGAGFLYCEEGDKIFIKTEKGSLLMTVEKPKKTDRHYKKLKEIDDTLSQIF